MENFREFEAGPDPFGRSYRIMFKWLQTAISIRHSDTIDVQFLVDDGTRIIKRTLAMNDADLKAHAKKTGRMIDDAWCSRLAASHLAESYLRAMPPSAHRIAVHADSSSK